MKGIFVSGISTDVGKTVVSAVLVEALMADYWKPIQSGELDNSDTMKVKDWVYNSYSTYHSEAYQLSEPMSPHAAAEKDGVTIEMDKINLPQTDNFLIAEGAGGLMVPLNHEGDMVVDIIKKTRFPVLLVSHNYLGSINHTLLTINELASRSIPVIGIIFNGPENTTSEQIILENSGIPLIGKINEIENLNKEAISAIAQEIKPRLEAVIH